MGGQPVRQQSKHELAAAVQRRYLRANRQEKGRILDEFVAATGYHRKRAIQLLRQGPPLARTGHGGRPRVYSPGVVGVLRQCAAASGWLCGKRLAPFLGELVPALEAEGVLRLAADVRSSLLALSAATIDRRLRPYRLARQPAALGTTKPGSLLKQQIPVQTYTPWDEQRVGFVEIDLVAHCASSTEGHYLNTLTVTDVASGWTECIGVWGKGQEPVRAALHAVRERLPFALLGIDSDNGSEFLNAHLLRYCQAEQLTFTRCRPYWKNDQAHVEQKNWSVVRQLLGYDRYSSPEALEALNAVYVLLRLWTNHWQPVLKLIGKERVGGGAKVQKHYDVAQTPYRRVLALAPATGTLPPGAAARLQVEHAQWGPLALRRALDHAVERFWTLCERRPATPARAGAAAVSCGAARRHSSPHNRAARLAVGEHGDVRQRYPFGNV